MDLDRNRLYIKGPQRMQGELLVQGSKNAALPILAATLLGKGIFILHHCPRISDVEHMLELLEDAGCRVRWEGHMLIVDTRELCNYRVSGTGAGKMRSTVTLLGSILGRMHQVEIPYPGGCTIGKRPIDLHLRGLEQLGAVFEHQEHTLSGKAQILHGAQIYLDFPSVGATENVLLAAVLAEGTTVLHGAAMEPEIVELADFLRKMGADVHGDGTPVITIRGVKKLHAAEYIVPSDRIVAGTYLFGAVMTMGEVRLLHIPLSHLGKLPELLEQMGAVVEAEEDWIYVRMDRQCRSIPYVVTAPFPGFPTDLQSALMAALSTASGMSFIEEKIFEARFQIVEELRKMGASISSEESFALIDGDARLHGARVEAKELRGGAALIMAALAAEGETCISGMEYVCRGYENINEDLKNLGIMV
ncbi:MAG: UDP-N-acetylglucosamine 1-carboxyvinyltransferase [Lachnospiraceae bacterium]|nr:UDP-N-acetylglucosamine 1-carboxyvinyltransferase [Lachnospiraceae bacterium]MCI9658977.1 UDP-N-acetylglucosamine 1-carboxyvinyltransferase [Lachnospiraceae bacterium]